ncbi:alpha-E domain-containing protein [Achromobacter ruhlandii]|uniref:alpha-E domain-containing protein n=2 Tax=Achromobacter ruhlandii TaxID=72557 RepID=UPI0014695047|nr:alpha-E domain-containing protein [Achromobacter ruhlandii]MCV6794430.1 alpha-E domain-containing protein [Achromobacter ruhlandii]MCV6801339.1 alpha-E domain-containing protein [Achromobacter ruhlandii]MCV6812278.1 alpha-E domain-containing protein [Achromobacter ruhlandii]MCV6817433.1 alpha-E domain-containing protein [Achromobacter ruhlandii]MCZ8394915.1 alpha-E domain-containing protein [Achromobacter ruhlandii]
MLSRTADNLFWMCRYTERAENTARMLDVNLQMSLLPQDAQTREGSWNAVLRISELQRLYHAKHAAVSPQDVLQYMVRDAENPSSIYSCMRAARENARAVRGSLTTEVWETYNTTWLELLKHLHTGLLERNPGEFFEWVKFRSHLARGVTIGTMLEDEALYFLRIGMHLERADNTARMLDVKFHERDGNGTPQQQQDGRGEGHASGALQSEFYRWSALLSSVSGLEIYRKVYRDVITPDRVAELLMLHPDMPRSLLAAMRAVSEDLARVSNQRSTETQRRAGMLCAELQFGRVEDILRSGLHQYLEHFLDRINDLGNRISQDFLVPLSA